MHMSEYLCIFVHKKGPGILYHSLVCGSGCSSSKEQLVLTQTSASLGANTSLATISLYGDSACHFHARSDVEAVK